MTRKTIVQQSHLTTRRKPSESSPNEVPPLCWLWREKSRILFVERTRGGKFAAYYVSDTYSIDRGQRKVRFDQLPAQELRGYMQITLDEFARERRFEQCRKEVYDFVQLALEIGEQQ